MARTLSAFERKKPSLKQQATGTRIGSLRGYKIQSLLS